MAMAFCYFPHRKMLEVFPFMLTIRSLAILIPGLLLAGCNHRTPAQAPATGTVRISVAASLADSLEKLRQPIRQQLNVDITLNPGGSGTLAQQIIGGAPCDLFLSASPQWVETLDSKGLLVPQGRRELLSAALVVVTRADAPAKPKTLNDLALPAFTPLALGDPRTVPAGQYAREALKNAGVWDHLSGKVAEAPDVRAALMFVASGQCPAGIVYAPDARVEPSVAVAFAVEPALHAPIRYVGALVRGPNESAAQRVLQFLAGPEARKVFEDAGFIPLPDR
jgi:molybdate transport system substrate-binding protein